MDEILHQLMILVGRNFIPLFTRFYTSQVVGNGISSINRSMLEALEVAESGAAEGCCPQQPSAVVESQGVKKAGCLQKLRVT